MAEDNNLPSLDELVFFEDDALADFSDEIKNREPIIEVDPTEEDLTDNDDIDNEDDTTDDDPTDSDGVDDLDTGDPADTDDDEDTDEGEQEDSEDLEGEDNDTPEGGSEYESYFNFLKDQGLLILGEEFEFDGSLEGFEKAIETTRNNMANQGAMMIWNQLPEDYRLVLQHGLAGGNDISQVREIVSSQTDLDKLDIEDEITQERILETYLQRTTKYNKDRIARSISRLKASGDLEEEAETALSELKDIYKEEREALVQEQMKEKEENNKRLQESYTNFTQVVEDMKLPESKKKKLVSSVWSVGDYGDYKDVSYFNYVDYMIKSNPEHLAQLAEMYLDYDPDKGFQSDKARKRAKSEVTKTFRDSIDTLNKTKSRTKTGKNRKTKSKTSDVDLLEQILNQNK
jgi:hypothetical protein